MKCDDVKFFTTAWGTEQTFSTLFCILIHSVIFIETKLSDMLFTHCYWGPFTHEVYINRNGVITLCEDHWIGSMSWSDKL